MKYTPEEAAKRWHRARAARNANRSAATATYSPADAEAMVRGALDYTEREKTPPLSPEAQTAVDNAVALVRARQQLTPAEAEMCDRTGIDPRKFIAHKNTLRAIGARR